MSASSELHQLTAAVKAYLEACTPQELNNRLIKLRTLVGVPTQPRPQMPTQPRPAEAPPDEIPPKQVA